jgi:hypothetical protein
MIVITEVIFCNFIENYDYLTVKKDFDCFELKFADFVDFDSLIVCNIVGFVD